MKVKNISKLWKTTHEASDYLLKKEEYQKKH
jgi:hypothetical protein